MTYKALVYFEDLQDNRHPYEVGDTFPRDGFAPSPERIAELCSTNNKRGRAVIEPVKQDKPEKQEEPFPMNDPVVFETVAQEEPVKHKRGRKRKEMD